MLRRFSLFFIFIFLLIATAVSIFSFDGNSSGYSVDNQFASLATSGTSASYSTVSSSVSTAGEGTSQSYSVTFGQQAMCGNNRCDPGETPTSCSIDCPATVSTKSSSGGGGGGGGGAGVVTPTSTTTEPIATSFSQLISADVPKVISFAQTPVSELTVTLSQTVYLASISVQKRTSLPATVSNSPLATTALVLEFSHAKIDNANFKSVSFVVAVPKSNELTADTISVYRFSNNVWESVPFTLTGQNTTAYLINVTAPGLSYFVVGKKTATVTNTVIAGDTIGQPDVTPPYTAGSPISSVPEVISTKDVSDSTQHTWLYLVITLIVASIIFVGFIFRQRLVGKVEAIQHAPLSPDATLIHFNQLDKWILDGIAKGYSAQQLQQKLISAGWKKEQLEEDFTRVLNELYRK